MKMEDILVASPEAEVKSEMVRQLQKRDHIAPALWQRTVFESLTGAKLHEVDWNCEVNSRGYFNWIKSFDRLVGELVDEGLAARDEIDGEAVLRPGHDLHA